MACTVKPHVEQYDKPKNVIEGDPFQSDCIAWGYPAVAIDWTHEKNFTGAEDRTSFKNGSSAFSTLRIEKVQYEDSGYYTCTARNELGARNATIQVNVKGMYELYWLSQWYWVLSAEKRFCVAFLLVVCGGIIFS